MYISTQYASCPTSHTHTYPRGTVFFSQGMGEGEGRREEGIGIHPLHIFSVHTCICHSSECPYMHEQTMCMHIFTTFAFCRGGGRGYGHTLNIPPPHSMLFPVEQLQKVHILYFHFFSYLCSYVFSLGQSQKLVSLKRGKIA